MSSEYIFTMYRVDKFYGAERQVLANISLSFLPGAKIGVLGANGAGKSTVLKIMAGKEEPSSGAADLAPNATVGFLEQEPDLDAEKTVRENVEDGVREVRDLLDRFNAISTQFAEPDADFDALLAEQSKVQDQIDRRGAWELEAQLDHAMDALRLPDGDRDVSSLSGGERRRVALCRLLLSSPDLLLLDEPTNHLDAESVYWLERFLADYKGTVVAVTHDRYFLDNVAGWILELDRGRGIPYQGNYSGWLEQKQQRLLAEEKTASARQRTLARELEWVRMAPKARHAKSKARLGAYEKLLAGEDSFSLDKVEIHIPPGPRLGDLVIDATTVSKGFGDRLLFDDLTFSLPPERRREDDALPDDRGPGDARLGRAAAGRHRPARLRRPVARRPRPEEHRVEGDLGRSGHRAARQEGDQLTAVHLVVQLPRRRPAEARRPAVGRRA
jgi:ATPase subunit of ABC transporter with duplicated ATPase domains